MRSVSFFMFLGCATPAALVPLTVTLCQSIFLCIKFSFLQSTYICIYFRITLLRMILGYRLGMVNNMYIKNDKCRAC